MYNLTHDVVQGMNIVTALQNHPNMPGINDVFVELDYFASCVMDTEQFYGVPFKHKSSEQGKGSKSSEPQFDVVADVKAHFREFYFGGSQEQTFGFRPRALFLLVIEPLLDGMGAFDHNTILDCTPNVVEQLKEHALMAEHKQLLDPAVAYKLYRQITTERVQEKKIKETLRGVLQYRKKVLPLTKEIKQLGKT